jgi:hypothetical protein
MLFDDNAEWCIPLRTATEAEETANRYILGEDGRPYILDWAALNANEELKKDLAIIEMKSINTWGFKEIAKSMQPEPAHYLQLQTYLWLTGIHEGYIIYEDKNDQTICEIPVTYDERVIYGTSDGRTKGLIVELSELGAMIDEGTVPARCPEAKENNFPCKWKTGQCDYYDYCWNPEHHGDKLPSQLVAPREIVAIGELSFYKDEVLEVMTAEELTQLQNLAIKFGSSVIPKIIAKAAIPADQLPAVSAAAEAAPAAESPAAPVTEASVVTATLATTPAAAAPIVTATPAAAPAKPSLLSVKNRQAKKDATLTPPPSEVGGTGAVKTVADVRQTQDAAVAAGAQLKQQQQDTAEQNAADGFATEFLNEQGERAIYCIKCGKEITYMRLANGNTIKCTNRKCQHVNKVKKS